MAITHRRLVLLLAATLTLAFLAPAASAHNSSDAWLTHPCRVYGDSAHYWFTEAKTQKDDGYYCQALRASIIFYNGQYYESKSDVTYVGDVVQVDESGVQVVDFLRSRHSYKVPADSSWKGFHSLWH